MVGSAVVGAAVCLIALGPPGVLFGGLLFSGAALEKGEFGVNARKVGALSLQALEKAKETDEQYGISKKIKENLPF